MISNGSGASVGLEAGYSQVGSGRRGLAQRLRLRRGDIRLMVGSGVAGAIGDAAFYAPLTGVFYAFELVIGGYTVPALAPVVASALAGSLVAIALGGHEVRSGLAASAAPPVARSGAVPGARRALAPLPASR